MGSRAGQFLSFSKLTLRESDLNGLWLAGVPLSGKIMGEKEKHVPIFLE
jgi:hypothetical protein